MEVHGTVYTDFLYLFSAGEIPFEGALTCLKSMDGHGAVVYGPSPDILGPDGKPIHTVYSMLRNIYSEEVRVEDMDDSIPPSPPPLPAQGDAPEQPPPGNGGNTRPSNERDPKPDGTRGGNTAPGNMEALSCSTAQRDRHRSRSSLLFAIDGDSSRGGTGRRYRNEAVCVCTGHGINDFGSTQ